MKTPRIVCGLVSMVLLLASVRAEGPGQHKFSNSRDASPIIASKEMPSMMAILSPANVRGWDGPLGSLDGWRGGWRFAPRYVIVEAPGGDYYFARPAANKSWKPESVYSRAWGKVVPYPVEYSGLIETPAPKTPEAGRFPGAVSRIEPTERANPRASLTVAK